MALVGEVKIWSGVTLPSNKYQECDGRVLSINLYPHLYNIIGATYGGDGQTTFALPDMRGKVPIGVDNSSANLTTTLNLGDQIGTEKNTLTVSQIPSHTHTSNLNVTGNVTVGVNSESPDVEEAFGNILGNTNADDVVYNESPVSGALGGVTHNLTVSGNITNTGGGQPVSNIQPSLAVRYIIKVQ